MDAGADVLAAQALLLKVFLPVGGSKCSEYVRALTSSGTFDLVPLEGPAERDGDRLVAEYNGGGSLLRRYVHGPGVDEPVVWYEGAAVGAAARRYL